MVLQLVQARPRLAWAAASSLPLDLVLRAAPSMLLAALALLGGAVTLPCLVPMCRSVLRLVRKRVVACSCVLVPVVLVLVAQ